MPRSSEAPTGRDRAHACPNTRLDSQRSEPRVHAPKENLHEVKLDHADPRSHRDVGLPVRASCRETPFKLASAGETQPAQANAYAHANVAQRVSTVSPRGARAASAPATIAVDHNSASIPPAPTSDPSSSPTPVPTGAITAAERTGALVSMPDARSVATCARCTFDDTLRC